MMDRVHRCRRREETAAGSPPARPRGMPVHVLEELKQHLPYTLSASMAGLILMALIYLGAELAGRDVRAPASEGLFHVFHLGHLLLSAAATTAMFRRHASDAARAVVVGFLGSVGVCGASDILFPYVGGTLLGVTMKLHVCLLEHPWSVFVFSLVGVVGGFVAPHRLEEGFVYSHSGHVLVSTAASMLYLVSFSGANWMRLLWGALPILVLGVLVPCCVSDIVLPLMAVRGRSGDSGEGEGP